MAYDQRFTPPQALFPAEESEGHCDEYRDLFDTMAYDHSFLPLDELFLAGELEEHCEEHCDSYCCCSRCLDRFGELTREYEPVQQPGSSLDDNTDKVDEFAQRLEELSGLSNSECDDDDDTYNHVPVVMNLNENLVMVSPSSSSPDDQENCDTSTERGIKRPRWTLEEDELLMKYVAEHGERDWTGVSSEFIKGRDGKSCRARWRMHLKRKLSGSNIVPVEDGTRVFEPQVKRLNGLQELMGGSLPGSSNSRSTDFFQAYGAGHPAIHSHSSLQQPGTSHDNRAVTAVPVPPGSTSHQPILLRDFSPNDQGGRAVQLRSQELDRLISLSQSSYKNCIVVPQAKEQLCAVNALQEPMIRRSPGASNSPSVNFFPSNYGAGHPVMRPESSPYQGDKAVQQPEAHMLQRPSLGFGHYENNASNELDRLIKLSQSSYEYSLSGIARLKRINNNTCGGFNVNAYSSTVKPQAQARFTPITRNNFICID